MKIGYVGNFQHPHCTEVHVAKTLRALGHEVLEFQESDCDLQTWEPELSDCALVLYTRTSSWGLPPAAHLLWYRLKQRGVTTASYHLDLFWGLDRQLLITQKTKDPLFGTEYVFTPDGGHDVQWERHGVNHHWLRPGVYEPECVPGRVRGRYTAAVGFLGSEQYHSEWPWRERLVNWLRLTYDDRFLRLGPGSESVRNEALNDALASITVCVGDSCMLGERYWSDRIYEQIGRGGVLIHPRIPELEQEFDGVFAPIWFEPGDFVSLHHAIEQALAEPADVNQERRRQGQAFVRANCTFTNRLTEALEMMGFDS